MDIPAKFATYLLILAVHFSFAWPDNSLVFWKFHLLFWEYITNHSVAKSNFLGVLDCSTEPDTLLQCVVLLILYLELGKVTFTSVPKHFYTALILRKKVIFLKQFFVLFILKKLSKEWWVCLREFVTPYQTLKILFGTKMYPDTFTLHSPEMWYILAELNTFVVQAFFLFQANISGR